jgi:hypothetical protein
MAINANHFSSKFTPVNKQDHENIQAFRSANSSSQVTYKTETTTDIINLIKLSYQIPEKPKVKCIISPTRNVACRDESGQFDIYTYAADAPLRSAQLSRPLLEEPAVQAILLRDTIEYFFLTQGAIRERRVALLAPSSNTNKTPVAFIISFEKPNQRASSELYTKISERLSKINEPNLDPVEELYSNRSDPKLREFFKTFYQIKIYEIKADSRVQAKRNQLSMNLNSDKASVVSAEVNNLSLIEQIVSLLKWGSVNYKQFFSKICYELRTDLLDHAPKVREDLDRIIKYRLLHQWLTRQEEDCNFKKEIGFSHAGFFNLSLPEICDSIVKKGALDLVNLDFIFIFQFISVKNHIGKLLKWLDSALKIECLILCKRFDEALNQLSNGKDDEKQIARRTKNILDQLSIVFAVPEGKRSVTIEFIYTFLSYRGNLDKLNAFLDKEDPINKNKNEIRSRFIDIVNSFLATKEGTLQQEACAALLLLIKYRLLQKTRKNNHGLEKDSNDIDCLKKILEYDKLIVLNYFNKNISEIRLYVNCLEIQFMLQFIQLKDDIKTLLEWLKINVDQKVQELVSWEQILKSDIQQLEQPWYKRMAYYAYSHTPSGMLARLLPMAIAPIIPQVVTNIKAFVHTHIEARRGYKENRVSELITEENIVNLTKSVGIGIGVYFTGGLMGLAQTVSIGTLAQTTYDYLNVPAINYKEGKAMYRLANQPGQSTLYRFFSLGWGAAAACYSWKPDPLFSTLSGIIGNVTVNGVVQAAVPELQISPNDKRDEGARKLLFSYLLSTIGHFFAQVSTESVLNWIAVREEWREKFLDNFNNAFKNQTIRVKRSNTSTDSSTAQCEVKDKFHTTLNDQLGYCRLEEQPWENDYQILQVKNKWNQVNIEAPALRMQPGLWFNYHNPVRISGKSHKGTVKEIYCQIGEEGIPYDCSKAQTVPSQANFIIFTESRRINL